MQADIGSSKTSGTASASGSSFTITAAGIDISGSADQFFFAYQAVDGDVEIRARLDDLDARSSSAQAGVMIRAALTRDAAHASTLYEPSGGAGFVWRRQAAATTTTSWGSSAVAPVWLRVVRTGTTLTSYSSTDGSAWTQIGQATISLDTTAYVGLAVTSQNPKATATAAFSQVTITRNALPTGQQAADIGAPAIAGSTTFSGGSYRLHAGGSDIGGAADQFQYLYQSVTGDADVTVRVASQTNSSSLAKAGVMFRASLDGGAANVALLTTPTSGYVFQRRAVAGEPTTSSSAGTGTAPVWLRLKRTGSLFTAYRSTDGIAWAVIGSDSIPMADPIYVGIAATSHSTTVASDVVADKLSVAAVQPADLPPSVTLTAPANGASFNAPASITISATASDPENQLSRVDFYNGSTLLGSDTTAPYTFAWSNVPAGTYALSAVARDSGGSSTQSVPVNVTVTAAAATSPPTGVIFQASADHAMVTSYRVDVFAAGANPGTSTPIAMQDVGRPTPDANNDISVSIPSFFSALAPGDYQLTVAAVSGTMFTRSTAIAFTK